MRLPTDGPIGKARMWYRQFYNPRNEAKAFQDRVNGVHTVRGMPGLPRAAE
jgi:3-ketosteroid 9alpha-monooxygenase subunit A